MGSKEGIKIIYAYFINDVSLFVSDIHIISYINEHTHTHTHIYRYRCIKIREHEVSNWC